MVPHDSRDSVILGKQKLHKVGRRLFLNKSGNLLQESSRNMRKYNSMSVDFVAHTCADLRAVLTSLCAVACLGDTLYQALPGAARYYTRALATACCWLVLVRPRPR